MNKIYVKLGKYLLTAILISSLSACGKKDTSTDKKIETSSSATVSGLDYSKRIVGDNSKLIAKVNDSPITYKDLERMTGRTLKGADLFDLGPEVEKKILDSMVASRAMAQAAEKLLDGEEKETIARDVRDYREQLLVKSYLKKNATPEPITQAMVQKYYDEHPDKFGGGKIKAYELISGFRSENEAQRNQLLKLLAAAEKKSDWNTYVNELRQRGLAVRFVQGKLKKDLLDERLSAAIEKLRPGKPAKVMFVDGIPYLPRVISEETDTPKPIAEVSAEIRRILLPQQLKKSIKILSDEILKSATIEYMDEGT